MRVPIDPFALVEASKGLGGLAYKMAGAMHFMWRDECMNMLSRIS